jgi:hypothetical protein
VYVDWHLRDRSWVHDIVDGKERWILIVWDHDRNGSQSGYFAPAAWLHSEPSSTASEAEALTRRARRGIGLATTFSDFELPIARPVDAPGAGQTQMACVN